MVTTGNGELGFGSGEGAWETATTSKEGSRRANYPIQILWGSDNKYRCRTQWVLRLEWVQFKNLNEEQLEGKSGGYIIQPDVEKDFLCRQKVGDENQLYTCKLQGTPWCGTTARCGSRGQSAAKLMMTKQLVLLVLLLLLLLWEGSETIIMWAKA